MKCTSPRSWGIFLFFAGPANNVDIFAVVESYKNIVTLYPQILFLRVVKPSQNVTQNNCSWPRRQSCFAFRFFFSSWAMDAVLIYRTLTHMRLYYDSLGRIYCPPTKMSALKNLHIPKSTWIDHCIDINGLQKMGFPRNEHFKSILKFSLKPHCRFAASFPHRTICMKCASFITKGGRVKVRR